MRPSKLILPIGLNAFLAFNRLEDYHGINALRRILMTPSCGVAFLGPARAFNATRPLDTKAS